MMSGAAAPARGRNTELWFSPGRSIHSPSASGRNTAPAAPALPIWLQRQHLRRLPEAASRTRPSAPLMRTASPVSGSTYAPSQPGIGTAAGSGSASSAKRRRQTARPRRHTHPRNG